MIFILGSWKQIKPCAGTAFLSLVVLCLLMAGCATTKKKDAEPPNPLVALLPLANQSIDVEAPEKVRPFLLEELKKRGYSLVQTESIDGALKEMGFRIGAVGPTMSRSAVSKDFNTGIR